MSYCVNCGVKLASSERKCPLCNTVVYNPNIKEDNYYPNYPKIKQSDIGKDTSGMFVDIAQMSNLLLDGLGADQHKVA